jgi:hypothetical protein
MERTSEEATTEEPARGGARTLGRPGQKPQEDPRGQAQRPSAAARAPQERVRAAISSIQARFGECAIGLGYLGIRYVPARHGVM